MSIYEYQVNTIFGKRKELSNYRGKVLLIVNIFSTAMESSGISLNF